MQSSEPSKLQRLFKVVQTNTTQLQFGNYSAQLSFYIIFTLVPLLLALANLISLLPFSQEYILEVMNRGIPSQVSQILTPIVQEYVASTSTGVFSIGVLISLWPASKIFATLENVLNEIYQVQSRLSFIGRVFAYIFTLGILIIVVSLSFVMVFGQTFFGWLEELLHFQWQWLEQLLSQSGMIGYFLIFLLLLGIYHIIPNVKRPIKYSLPGALVTTIGFGLVSNLFQLYLSFTNRASVSNATLGVFIVLFIWLYLNGMVLCLGAYTNVIFYDYWTLDYYELLARKDEEVTYHASSEAYDRYMYLQPHLSHQVLRKEVATNKGEDIE